MYLSPHPFLAAQSAGGTLPPQLLPLDQKTEHWRKACMDALEGLGFRQYWDNQKLRENYRMASGEFLLYQYQDEEPNEYASLIQLAAQYSKEDQPMGRMRHFDFTRQVINTLTGELESHPAEQRVVAKGDSIDSARSREKARLLSEYVHQQIDAEINAALIEQGLDPQKSDFQSPEQQQAYSQQVEEARKALTPEEIQRYMSSNWQHVAEIWGNITLEDAQERYQMKPKASLEFGDMLKVDRCFRHFYLTGTGFTQESWNPLETFFHTSPDVTDVEKGNYAGRVTFLSLPDIIDRYGHLMDGSELEDLYGKLALSGGYQTVKDWYGNPIDYLSIEGMPYGVKVPTTNPDLLHYLPQVSQTGGGYPAHEVLFGTGNRYGDQRFYYGNLYQVTEAYWKSQKRVGRLTWLNPETGQIEKVIVDETVVLPQGTKEKKGNLTRNDPDEDSVFTGKAFEPTIEWTWINEVWGGIKLMPMGSQPGATANHKPLYLAVKPLDFQGKPDAFLYEPELPVVGSVFTARNAPSQSLVDLMKPYQIAYNLFMNQALTMAEEEILPFLLMDPNLIPTINGWNDRENGGFLNWLQSIRDTRLGLADTRPSVTQGANLGGQLPQVINLDATSRMIARVNLAMSFKQMALEQVGFSPQRLGDVKPTETATGVNTAAARSYIQTAPLFTRFFDYIRRVNKKTLDFAQFCQATDRDITVSTIHSDYSNSLLTLNGTELLLAQLHVYVTDAQAERRNLEIARQLALENNTSTLSASDRIEMGTGNSLEKIKQIVKNSELKNDQLVQQSQQLEQQKLAAAQKLQDDRQSFEAEQNELDREARKEEAYIRTFGGKNNTTMGDTNNDGTPDSLQFAKLSQAQQAQLQKQQADQQKNELARTKLLVDNQQHQDGLREAQAERASREKIARMKISQAQIQGDKSR
ncbi:hypothetical protein CLV58_109160 [Spirosoma oryzae]|uniref:Uncharacterized protein n=1 Tax=Spirosoma oryzae TaxID=1469603 RepID=A0A2T0SYJ6_9BACT|nr:hypothetical protein [Spirosoma oryzae]PRY38433.1 hypothetical protein CLV58_109160 [Spirosoma oryzae]